MDLLSTKIIKELLAKHEAKPSKIMGQNFLIDANALAKVVEAAQLDQNDTILEIGPGMGVLTRELAKTAKKVIAVEKDRNMLNILQETVGNNKNIEVIQGDALKLSITNFQLSNYKVVANIPYYLTSPIIRKFLEAQAPPKEIVLMVQKEVAQRICAKPPNMSLLAISVQFYATAQIISYVSKGCFWPAPKVDSAIIAIRPRKDAETNAESRRKFFETVRAGFSQPRKQLANNLSKALKMDRDKVNTWLMENGIQSQQRAETLNVEDWVKLTISRPDLAGLTNMLIPL